MSRNESYDSEQPFWDEQVSAMSARITPGGGVGSYEGLFNVSYHDLQILNKIGFGSCSAVRLAVHRVSGKKYAVKVFNVNNLIQAEQLKKEVIVLASLPDSNALMTLQGLHHLEGSVSVILDYMDRGSLEHFIEYKKSSGSATYASSATDISSTTDVSSDLSQSFSSPFLSSMVVSSTPDAPSNTRITETVIAAITYQVLVGLNCLHTHRKMHRDVKPANILLNSLGYVKLSDFGISREENEHGSEPKSNLAYMGTCMYMSPERLLGLAYDNTADIWSVGIIILELWNEYPFSSCCGTPVDLLEELDNFDFDTVLSKLPLEMASILVSMVHIDPSKRKQCDELIRSNWFASKGIRSIDEARLTVLKWLTASEDASPGRCMGLRKRSSFTLDVLESNTSRFGNDLKDVMVIESTTSLSHISFSNTLNESVLSTESVKKAKHASFHMLDIEEEYYYSPNQQFCHIDSDCIKKATGMVGSNFFQSNGIHIKQFQSSEQWPLHMQANQQDVQFMLFLKTIERSGYECTVYLQQKTGVHAGYVYSDAINKRCDAVLRKKKDSDKVAVEINLEGKARLFRFALVDIIQLGLGPGAASSLPIDTPVNNILFVSIRSKGELSLVFEDLTTRNEVYRGLEVLIEASSNIVKDD